jgi:hypothetical protein
MPIHITMRDAATKITDWALSRENLIDERRDQIYEGRVYNTLATLFNASTVMLVIGVVSAIFLAMSSAFVFLALGLFLRATTEKEMETYTLPVQAQQPPEAEPPAGVAALWGRLRDAVQARHQTRLLQHALHQTSDDEKVQNIFDNVGLERQDDFVPDELFLFGFSGWKNSINIPEVVVQRRAEEGGRQEQPDVRPAAAQNNNANAGGALGGFANLARRLVGAGAAAVPAANAGYNGGDA